MHSLHRVRGKDRPHFFVIPSGSVVPVGAGVPIYSSPGCLLAVISTTWQASFAPPHHVTLLTTPQVVCWSHFGVGDVSVRPRTSKAGGWAQPKNRGSATKKVCSRLAPGTVESNSIVCSRDTSVWLALISRQVASTE